jgi:hypothetical protein
VTPKQKHKHCPECPELCFCGSSKQLEDNHFGCRRHVPDIYLPFCGEDHATFHVLCRRAGINFRAIKDRSMALIQALKAMLIGLWMVVDRLEKQITSQPKAEQNGNRTEDEFSKKQ